MKNQSLIILISTALLSPLEVTADEPQTHNIAKQQITHSHRGPKSFDLENADGATITLWKPDLSTQTLTPVHSSVTLPVTGVNNYHVLVAEKDWGDHKEAIIHYAYLHGRPSHQSPAKIAAAQKTEFEIVPDPIPREHYRYHTLQEWGFLVRMQGSPLAGQPITLTTSHGTQHTLTTGSDGRVEFQIPDDFPDLEEGERDRRQAQFSVSSEYSQDEVNYSTQLIADYRINPSHWQSTQLGLLVIGLGFLAGGYLGRNIKNAGDQA
jgi:hypothetical protein